LQDHRCGRLIVFMLGTILLIVLILLLSARFPLGLTVGIGATTLAAGSDWSCYVIILLPTGRI
jgi:hypothetical protein